MMISTEDPYESTCSLCGVAPVGTTRASTKQKNVELQNRAFSLCVWGGGGPQLGHLQCTLLVIMNIENWLALLACCRNTYSFWSFRTY